MRFAPSASIALLLLAGSLHGQPPDYEAWNRARILTALNGLSVGAEAACGSNAIPASAWSGMQDAIAELHGGRISPYDGVAFPNFHYVQIEHIVARKEADESGLCARGVAARTAFAADILNLTLAPGSLNASKGDRYLHAVQSAETSLFRDSLTEHALCWWAAQTVRVKSKHRLRVDTDEKAALSSVLSACADDQVFRPRLAEGADWAFRREYVDSLSGERDIPFCASQVASETNLRLAVIATTRYLEDLACLPGDPPEEEGDDSRTVAPPATAVADPRADQKAAQTACICTLAAGEHRTNCTNVKRYCPDVEPILRGEPLYGSLRDSDGDGTVCESL